MEFLTPEWLIKKLVWMRTEAGLSQEELGRRLGKYQAWVQRRESGQSQIQIGELDAWATATGFKLNLSFEPVPNEELQMLQQYEDVLRQTRKLLETKSSLLAALESHQRAQSAKAEAEKTVTELEDCWNEMEKVDAILEEIRLKKEFLSNQRGLRESPRSPSSSG